MTASETKLEWLVRISFSVFRRCLLLTFSHSLLCFRDKESYIGTRSSQCPKARSDYTRAIKQEATAAGSLCSGLPFDQFTV